MLLSTRWLTPLALGAALLAAAPGSQAQNDSQAGAAPQRTQGSTPSDADSAAGSNGASHDDSAAAHADELDRTPRDCLILSDIRQTVVLDDRTILFYMRGGKKDVYRNYLPHECPNLAREGRFSYKTPLNRLCNIDLITVLEQFGPGLTPGFTCRLGDFYPITYEEAEILRKEKDNPDGPRGNAVKSKPAELPDKKGAAPAPAEGAAPESAPQ
jgi:hypothetical protein